MRDRRTNLKSNSRWLIACLFAAVCGQHAFAAESATAIPETAATEGFIGEYVHPPIDPNRRLTGMALLNALRKGGFVLYMRHTETGTVTSECDTSNLTPRGERDAARVGEAIKVLRIPIAHILSSPVCRVQGTAKALGLGSVELSEGLTNQSAGQGFNFHAAREKLLATQPAQGKNTLLVGHVQAGNSFDQALSLDFGEVIAFLPDGRGGRQAIARVRVDQWADLRRPNQTAGDSPK